MGTGHNASGVPATNGFSDRYALMFAALEEHFEVHAVEATGTATQSDTAPSARRITTSPPPGGSSSRLEGLMATAQLVRAGFLRRPEVQAWEEEVSEALRVIDPCVVIVIDQGARYSWNVISREHPTIIVAEEDFRDLGGGRMRRARHHLDRWGRSRIQHPPELVVVISEAEAEWAAARFPGSVVEVLDHVIDTSYWHTSASSAPTSASDSLRVLCVARWDHQRNHNGLTRIAEAVLAENSSGIRVELVAAGVCPPRIAAALSRAGVSFLGRPGDLRPLYEQADVALVPAFSTNGAKTTILQAWAMGLPLVTTTGSMASMGAGTEGAGLVGSTPAEIAGHLSRLTTDIDVRQSLASAGRRVLTARHSPPRFRARVLDLVHEASGCAPRGYLT